MFRTCLLALSLIIMFSAFNAGAQKTRLTDNPLFGIDTTSPDEFLNYPLGEWLLRHDQINFYLKQLAQENPRVSLENSGQSHEARQQLTAVITSAKNQLKLTEIIAQRQGVKRGLTPDGPLIIWLAYSIHGDEASGAHAALKLSHMLATSEEKWVIELLADAVVLITPSQNPDGLDRFSNWANGYHGKIAVSDPNHNEHKQAWPGGRSNHYLADLNRDWLFLRHPESRGRVALFHKWQPHYVGDFHEMGYNQTYFFQPGVPERTHPLSPATNAVLTAKLAKFHQAALDDIKQSYFSRQMFDDFFYGKGSTYPDINGAIGILFEQASPRGQQQDSVNGQLTFKNAIANHYATSVSSLKGAMAHKSELREYQADFFKGKYKTPKARAPRQGGFLFSAPADRARITDLADLLTQHHIEFYYLTHPLTQGHMSFAVDDSVFVPVNQPQSALLQTMFDKRTEFADPTFYDISTWNLQYAYNLQVRRNVKLELSVLSKTPPIFESEIGSPKAVALLIDWRQSNAAPMLEQLLQQNIRVKFAAKSFAIAEKNRELKFAAGTLQIPLKQDHLSPLATSAAVEKIAAAHKIRVIPAYTSSSVTGIDLGSPDFKVIKPVRPLLVTGKDTSIAEVGQLWYYLDSKLKIPTSLVDINRLTRLPLGRYTHIILADGRYTSLDEKFARKLGQFVTQGGVIIAQKGALGWLSRGNLLKTDLREARYYRQLFSAKGLAFDEKDKYDARQAIGGAIVELKLDKSHPISFGIIGDRLPVMKNKALGFSGSDSAFSVAANYTSQPLLSGYLAAEYERSLANTPAILVESRSKGAVVSLADNLMFRNIWLGSEKVYANALYFIPVLH